MYNKVKNYPVYLLCICLTVISCNKKDFKSYEGQKIEIDYLHTEGFDNDDWIEIDGIRFDHVRNMKVVRENGTAIPTSTVVKDSLGKEKIFEASYNSLSIAILLGNKFSGMGENETSEANKLIISEKELLMTLGKLRIIKKDSSSFTIRTSKKYPASVNVMDLE